LRHTQMTSDTHECSLRAQPRAMTSSRLQTKLPIRAAVMTFLGIAARQSLSSLPSKQSSCPSHRHVSKMQRFVPHKSIHVLCLHPMWWSTADHLTLTSLTLISTFMMSLKPLILSEVLPLPPPVPQLHLQHPLSSKSTVSTRHVQTNLP
uniref:Uncharacterized protein n=1 Tax=Cynoglossus semilaevis TaxID=244447 RepID=A0A3P8VGL7_CYNSE